MSFFRMMGRIISGKPVYTPQDVQSSYPQPAVAGEDPATVQPQPPMRSGRKTIPVVRIGRVESHVSGQRLDVYANIRNESSEMLYLDRIFVQGMKRELDSELRPGASRQALIYSGPLLLKPPTGYAELQYRKQSDGDYFADFHVLRSRPEGASGYIITDCLLQGPVKDI